VGNFHFHADPKKRLKPLMIPWTDIHPAEARVLMRRGILSVRVFVARETFSRRDKPSRSCNGLVRIRGFKGIKS
jgi:hypothetical protein